MQLSTYCQNYLHCISAILLIYFINTSSSAYLRNNRRHHHRENNRHMDRESTLNMEETRTRNPPLVVVAETSPPTTAVEVQHEESSSSDVYSSREDENMNNNNDTRQLCPSCELREHQKALRLESIKKMILNKLRMSQAPNISSRPSLPSPLEHLVRSHPELSSMQGDDPMFSDSRMSHESPGTDATTEKMITFAKRSLPHVNQIACCYFNISQQLVGYSVSKATLYFYVNPTNQIRNPVHELVVKKVINKSNRKHKGYIVKKMDTSKKVELNPRHGEWMNVDFTEIVQDWSDYPENNLGIALELLDDGGNNVVVTDVSDEQEKKPFLQLKLRANRVRRSKRSTGPICVEDGPERRCCRYPLEVDFSEFNWDWIIAPKTFDANFCSGRCPRMINVQYPHTQIMAMVDPRGYTGPCCSASDMSSLTLLYFDDELNIKYSELPNMRVETCGCA